MNERLAIGDASGVDAGEALDLAMRTESNGHPPFRTMQCAPLYPIGRCKKRLKHIKYHTISALSRDETSGAEISIPNVVSANKLQEIDSFNIDRHRHVCHPSTLRR